MAAKSGCHNVAAYRGQRDREVNHEFDPDKIEAGNGQARSRF